MNWRRKCTKAGYGFEINQKADKVSIAMKHKIVVYIKLLETPVIDRGAGGPKGPAVTCGRMAVASLSLAGVSFLVKP